MRRTLIALVGSALWTFCMAPAWAQTGADAPGERLKGIERSLASTESERAAAEATAAKTAADLLAVKQRLVAVAEAGLRREAVALALEEKLQALEAAERDKAKELDLRRSELTAMVAALQRLARHPPVALAALPTSPADTMRSSILLRDGVPRLEERAASLKADIDELARLRGDIAAERATLGETLGSLAEERKRLEQLAHQKSEIERTARTTSAAAQSRSTELAAKARDLRDLIERIEAERRRQIVAVPPPKPPVPQAPRESSKPSDSDAPPTAAAGDALLPAHGRILAGFGERSGAAEFRGIAIATRPSAQVVAPREGAVVFAGPFKGYGQLLIIEHGDGYHVLLAGLSRLDAAAGDEVLAGEPVGVMDSSSNGRSTLYVELRRHGQPINPLPWLAASKRKVNG